MWKDRNTSEVREAQRHADYAYRLAVDAPAAKELRLFGLSEWIVDRFTTRRRKLLDLQYHATPLRERSLLLALARGFMRDSPLLLVLDEPTAALDAETEHALFERYAAAVRGDGRITILVSHRFSTVRMADRIVVIDGSRVVETGTHDELMSKCGQYAELYRIQAASYR